MLVVDLTVLLGLAGAVLWSDPISGTAWASAGVLLAATAGHIAASAQIEERRRHRTGDTTTHNTDLAMTWPVVAALLALPIPLALAVILGIRALRWPSARKSAFRYTFSTMTFLPAAVAARMLWDLTGPHMWTGLTVWTSAVQVVLAIACGEVFGIVQNLIITAARALNLPPGERLDSWSPIGPWRDEALSAAGMVLGTLAAVSLTHVPIAVLAVAAVGAGIHWALSHQSELEQTRAQARTDPKTGTLNSFGWQEQATRQVARARGNHRPISLLMIDADHFKLINDAWGHPTGDAVLRLIGDTLRSVTRPGDVVARFGGEEFVVLLPDTGAAEAFRVAERIRATLGASALPATDRRGGEIVLKGRDAPPPRGPGDQILLTASGGYVDADYRAISASVGVAASCGQTADLRQLMERADAAMYRAKKRGRNTVWLDTVRLGSAGDPDRR
ncbi:GGDEF domain-containing protein [Solihabitans fulvus]|nr:GGDEF domain-containing protein [Solihabitans fulvus]